MSLAVLIIGAPSGYCRDAPQHLSPRGAMRGIARPRILKKTLQQARERLQCVDGLWKGVGISLAKRSGKS
jgi:hypothetical protein